MPNDKIYTGKPIEMLTVASAEHTLLNEIYERLSFLCHMGKLAFDKTPKKDNYQYTTILKRLNKPSSSSGWGWRWSRLNNDFRDSLLN